MKKVIVFIVLLGLSINMTAQESMKHNIFEIIHSEFGSEEFEINAPKYNLYKTDDGIWEFTINFNCPKAVKRASELDDIIDAKPKFEATAIIAPSDLHLEKGKTIIQKEGYDYEREEHLSNVYYFEHNSVEELEINILDCEANWILINARGKAIINGSNGDQTDADLFIHQTKFHLDKTLERSVM